MTPKIKVDLEDADEIRKIYRDVHEIWEVVDSLHSRVESLFNLITQLEIGTRENKAIQSEKIFMREIRRIEYD
jgi:hypothetical protein|tara:strand:- start:628 stop:846 length:219 start_codon:yes stop_codon:yes gene_type:complete